LVHGLDELRSPLRGYVVFNGDQDRATSIGIGVDDSRQAPIINGSATIDHETARKRRFVAVEK
jgi:hypothetical protein